MARKRDQEDVFQPLNESPAEMDEPQSLPDSSGRGWEIKLGLLVLVLLVGATGYFVYRHLTSGSDVDETADASSHLKRQATDDLVQERPVTAEAGVVAEPQPLSSDSRALVMTQWNDASDTAKAAQASTWTSSEPAGDPVSPPLGAVPSQSYAANYGSDPQPQATPSPETTFAPMPNPNDFTTGVGAPLPAETPVGTQVSIQNNVGGEAMTPATGGTVLNGATPHAETVYSAPSTLQREEPLGSGQIATTQDIGPAPQSDNGSTPWKSQPGPSAPQAFSPPTQPQPAQDDTAPAPGSHAAVATPTPYAPPSTLPPPAQDTYPSYTPATSSKTQADFAGLSANRGPDEASTTETWQQPVVIPVDGRYTAQPNDNFYTISKKVYGSGAYFEALAEYNKDKYPKADQIRIGDSVQTPSAETLESRYPELCPKPEHREAAKRRGTVTASRALAGRRVYVVQQGDNLFDIARFELGARSKVAELIELNRDVLGDHINYLTPGMQLLLPETDARGPAITQAPTNSLR